MTCNPRKTSPRRPAWLSEQVWRALLSIAPNGIAVVQGSKGIVVEANGWKFGVSMPTSVQPTIEAMQAGAP
jgi:hypothetical protein